MSSNRTFIGIDAGGTKTDVCICDFSGAIKNRIISAGTNAARDGAAACAEHITDILRNAGHTAAEALYIGAAGAGSSAISAALTTELQRLLPGIKSIKVASDAFNALNAEVSSGDGIALIAGTGSSAFARANGEVFQVGGRGYLIDDAGSGYWTGRACLNAAYRAIDGRGPATSLVCAIEKILNKPLTSAIPDIYSGGAAYIASFAPLVFEQAALGDAVALAIADECASELEMHLKACAAKYPGLNICVASGGMFHVEYIQQQMDATAAALGIRMIYSTLPPVCGAVCTAAELAGVTDIEAFRRAIKHTFSERTI